MKKLFMTVLTTSALTSAALQALPLGNPSEASLLIDGVLWEGVATDPCDPCATWCDAISVRMGFYGDYVFDRFLKNSLPEKDKANLAYDQKLTKSEVFTNAGYLALNIWDRFDVFGTLGATGLHLEGPSNAYNLQDSATAADVIGNTCIKLDGKHGFSWSVGIRGSLWECGCATLGGEFQYMGARPNVDTIEVDGNTTPFVLTQLNKKAKYAEWQLGLGLSYRINLLTPYLGIKWSRATIDFDGAEITQPATDAKTGVNINSPLWDATGAGAAKAPIQTSQFKLNKNKSGRNFGFVVGSTLVDADKVSVTVEARYGDERAVHVNGQFRF